MRNAQNSISGIYFVANFRENGKISMKDSKFKTFWVLGSDLKSTKFWLLVKDFVGFSVEMLEICVFLSQNS